MKTALEIRRRQLLGELSQVNRQIAQTQKLLSQIESRLALASQTKSKAA